MLLISYPRLEAIINFRDIRIPGGPCQTNPILRSRARIFFQDFFSIYRDMGLELPSFLNKSFGLDGPASLIQLVNYSFDQLFGKRRPFELHQ